MILLHSTDSITCYRLKKPRFTVHHQLPISYTNFRYIWADQYCRQINSLNMKDTDTCKGVSPRTRGFSMPSAHQAGHVSPRIWEEVAGTLSSLRLQGLCPRTAFSLARHHSQTPVKRASWCLTLCIVPAWILSYISLGTSLLPKTGHLVSSPDITWCPFTQIKL